MKQRRQIGEQVAMANRRLAIAILLRSSRQQYPIHDLNITFLHHLPWLRERTACSVPVGALWPRVQATKVLSPHHPTPPRTRPNTHRRQRQHKPCSLCASTITVTRYSSPSGLGSACGIALNISGLSSSSRTKDFGVLWRMKSGKWNSPSGPVHATAPTTLSGGNYILDGSANGDRICLLSPLLCIPICWYCSCGWRTYQQSMPANARLLHPTLRFLL